MVSTLPFHGGSTGSSPVGAISKVDQVPNEPFRKRFLELNAQGVSARSICIKIGISSKSTSYLKRVLGIKPWTSSRPEYYGNEYYSTYLRYSVAVRLADAMDMDFLKLEL